jgi:hypothetical protein
MPIWPRRSNKKIKHAPTPCWRLRAFSEWPWGRPSISCCKKIDTTWTIGSHTFTIYPFNLVGLLLAFGNVLVLAIVMVFLEEPTEKELKRPNAAVSGPSAEKQDLWKALLCIEIQLPLFTLLVVNSSFQLYVHIVVVYLTSSQTIMRYYGDWDELTAFCFF